MPNAEEGISCKISAYKLHGRPVLYLAAWKRHYSLYRCIDHLIATLKDDLAL